ncbi:AraC family transcriptional regulator [uncultured Aquimarina sp.]|uniref:helix-turn-helix domain-containing protein n=1 Tax=uncultured Aquimarina sp. TaxID=575652 RepID=UPI00262A38B5|nr:AraC family transcriptional regulator [uncultured Aquimarina sp.]
MIFDQTKNLRTSDNKKTILKKGQYLAPSYQIQDFKDFLIGISNYQDQVETGVWHAHENPLISFVLYGGNKEYRKGKEMDRVSGSINYYHSLEPHKNIYYTFPSKHISLELSNNFLKKYNYTETDIEFATKKNYDGHFTFIKLMKEAQINDLQSYASIEMLFLSFLENSEKSYDQTLSPSWILSVRDILNDRWNENISLKELAYHVNVHPTTISKNFKKHFQCTLGEYTRKLKVNRSLKILGSSHYSLTEIAHICGFSDQSHFIRVFKSMTNHLPSEYLKI